MSQETLLKPGGYSCEEIGEILGKSVSELERRYTTKFPIRAECFRLRQRALHVFSEAIRVLDFRMLLSSPPSNDPTALPARLGQIMNETQRSCRDLYDCSCPELDEICVIALEAGAFGSRLTGAGWGGCTVHLVPQDKVLSVKQQLETRYYRKNFPELTPDQLARAVVVSKPGGGSCFWLCNDGRLN